MTLLSATFLLYGCGNHENPVPGDDPIQVDLDPMDDPSPQPEENSVKLAEDATFGQDAERGDNKGVSVPTPGIWSIVNIDTPELQ